MLEKILDFVYPKKCLICGKKGENKYICEDCFSNFDKKVNLRKVRNKPYEYVLWIDRYENLRRNIIRFKFYGAPYYSEYFGMILLKDKENFDFLKTFDLVIPIPMFKKKKLKRGYNQAELLANYLSKQLKINISNNNLVKTRENKTQSLLSKEERRQNVKDVFKVTNSEKILNKKIILVDDIITTGTTISEASRILKESGVKKIVVVSIAKV